MRDYTLDKVKTLIVDPDQVARQAIRTILFNAGFRSIDLGGSLEDIKNALENDCHDLIISECRLPDGEFLHLLQDIRRHSVGCNPFATLVALVPQDESADLVTQAMTFGVDDIVAKPVATTTMLSRLTRLIEKRRPYVVNGEYVGPKRKIDSQAKEIEVPNFFAMRARGENPTQSMIEKAVARANADIELKRLELLVERIAVMMEDIAAHADDADVVESQRAKLVMLVGEAQYARFELEETDYTHMGDLCIMISKLAEQILTMNDPRPSMVKVLEPLASALRRGMVACPDGKRVLAEITGLIAA